MAFTEVALPYSRYKFFSYYAESTSSLSESFDPDCAFELECIRIHLSTGHASVEDFVAYVSANKTNAAGSANLFDTHLFSYAINGSTDYMWHPSRSLFFDDGDTIVFSMIMSAGNHFGLTVQGWAITS